MKVLLNENEIVDGDCPIVIIGANGVGKTTLGVKLLHSHEGTRISAHRSLMLGSQRHVPEQAEQQVSHVRNNSLQSPWAIVDDFDALLTKVVAESADALLAWERAREANSRKALALPEVSKIARVSRLWHDLLPKRQLTLGWRVRVKSLIASHSAEYDGHAMSDGERGALYLLLQVYEAKPGLLVIDEPTLHLHAELARRFWNALEKARPDCRFVYITHDLDFAMSRRNARMVVMRSEEPRLQVVAPKSQIPIDALRAIVGSASFAIAARRIVLCESLKDGDDERLYALWFNDDDTAVVPIGTSPDVVKAAEVLAAEHLVRGAEVVPIVDRDDHSDEHVAALEGKGIYVLKVSELEALYCLQGVFLAVARVLRPKGSAEELMTEFRAATAKRLNAVEVNRRALERTRRAARHILAATLDKVAPNPDFESMKRSLVEAADPARRAFDLPGLLESEKKALDKALAGDWDTEVLRYFPGKTILGAAADTLKVGVSTYKEQVLAALAAKDSKEPSFAIQSAVVAALAPHLPPRTVSPQEQSS